MRDDIVADYLFDYRLRVIVDDVSDGKRTEFRASIYDENNDLLNDGWGATVGNATHNALIGMEVE